MLAKTHSYFAMSSSSALMLATNILDNEADITGKLLIATSITLGSYACSNLPDIDKKIPIIKHRTWTHTIWSILLIYAITAYHYINPIFLNPLNDFLLHYFLIGSLIGYISHIAVDTFSPQSVPLIYPILKNIRLPFPVLYTVGKMKSGTKIWKQISIILIIGGLIKCLI